MGITFTRASGRRLLAVTVGAVAVGAFLAPASTAASPQGYSAGQLSAASSAVERSGVAGVAWHVDAAANRVVVTADSSVSSAEIATLRKASGSNAGALRIQRTAGV